MKKSQIKVTRYLSDSLVAIATALEAVTEDGGPEAAERAIKSAYYGLDNALVVVRRNIKR